jgi:septal ring factor EnvC (AmiA/AmiB activator)
MYKHRSKQNRWYFILSADGFAQMTRRTRYLREYADWRKRQANSILERQVEISKKQAEVAQARADKQQLLNQRGQEAAQLQKEESDRRREVEKLSAKRKELQTQLAQKQKQERALRQQIERLITKELEREQERQRLAEKVPTSPKKPSGGGESKSPSPETPSASMSANAKDNANLTASFVANKGRLPFPLTGKYKVVMKFGDRTHPDLQYVRLRNSGIDIQTTAGSEAQSIFAGKVTARFMAPGYNWGIIVRHGSYLSVYVNLSEVYVNIDEKVTARQRLGKIATDISNNRATILHFELHKEKEALDPEAWIK